MSLDLSETIEMTKVAFWRASLLCDELVQFTSLLPANETRGWGGTLSTALAVAEENPVICDLRSKDYHNQNVNYKAEIHM